MSVKNSLLIESMYAGPVRYYATLLQFEQVELELSEHFVKSSYRNRCVIASPDGPLTLTVPIEHGRNKRRFIRDTTIFNEYEWRKKHWESLQLTYRSTPYFEYFEDDLSVIYQKEYKYLHDWNRDIMNFVLEQLDVDLKYSETEEYEKQPEGKKDMRSHIIPNLKKTVLDDEYESPVYKQLFEAKTGFLPELSIFDLLFAQGPAAVPILYDCFD